MKSITIPWAAWYGDLQKELTFTEQADIRIMTIDDRPAVTEAEIDKELLQLSSLIQSKHPERVIIVIDDLTRPLKIEPLLNVILDSLEGAHISRENTVLLVGLGGHRPLSENDLRKKVGQRALEKCVFVNHDPFNDLLELPYSWKGTPVQLNKYFVTADFRIVISGLVPHNFAGFSGGAKMLFPGIANFEMIKRTHKSVLMGLMGKSGEMDKNHFRKDIELLAGKIGVDLFIGLVGNTRREITALFCGDIVKAHRQAAQYAKEYYTASVEDGEYDVVLLNAFPKDTELLQSENAFIPLHSASKKFVKEGGVIIVASACSEGIGHHELFGPGKALYRKPQAKRSLNAYDFIFYSEKISGADFRKVYWEGYQYYSNWQSLNHYLSGKFSTQYRVLVFPYASVQLVS